MNNDTYNGWSNYETLKWKLWLDKEQSTHEYWKSIAKEITDTVDPEYDWQTPEEAWIAELVYRLTIDMDEQATALDIATGPFAEIMNAGLGKINWKEIAESLLDEVQS